MEQKEQNIKIKINNEILEGFLTIPKDAKEIILFAHGSGSSRFSSRNQYVAKQIQKAKIATLLFDLLTQEEEIIDEQTAHLRFNIPLLAERLDKVTNWLKKNPETKTLLIGYFGASTGSAAALISATIHPEVKAIVSRGGRPDLALDYLPQVKSPTLLIVGGDDTEVIEMNKEAMAKMKTETKLEIIPGATHLFVEPGKLEIVAKLAADWFLKHLPNKK